VVGYQGPGLSLSKEGKIRLIARTRRARPALLLAMLLAGMLAATACANVTGPQGWAAPLALDDTLLVSTDRGKLSALERDGLAPVWTFPSGDEADKRIDLEALYGRPAVSGDVIYIGAYDGSVHALDLATGRPKWALPFVAEAPIIAGVLIVGDSLYAASDDGNLYVLDARTGEETDRFSAGDSIWSTPLLANGILYVASVKGKLFALDSDLNNTWDEPFEAEGGLLSDLVVADETTLLVGGIGRRLYAVDIASGKEKWSFKGENWFWARPLVAGNTVYAPNLDGRVYALNLQTGRPAWEKPFQTVPESPIRSGPALAGGVLVVADRQGMVYGLSPDDGSLKWGPILLNKAVLADPELLGQEVVISAQGGDLFRLDPSNGSLQAVEAVRR